MSGCYRCGLPDGSESRLCDTCFGHKFHCGHLQSEANLQASATGIELSPRMQRFLLSGGAVAYLAVLSLGVAVQGEREGLRQAGLAKARLQQELVTAGSNQYTVTHHQEFGFLAGPAGDLLEE